jgi:alkylation response protein AidB-like acyl-CoA dehydrogenase
LRGEINWCQLFSEPGAGSDLASLSMRATRVEGGWVLNGQKVWTSMAREAEWGICLARSAPDRPKHEGISCLMVDMKSPGVEVRPLRQLTGGSEFNEVFFENVRIADSEMLGKPGDGWRVSLTTLMNERVSIGGTMPQKGSGTIQALTSTWANLPDERRDPAARDEVMKLWSRAEVLRLTNIRANQNRKMGDPGPEGSIAKMAYADLNKDIYAMVMNLLGAEGMLYGSYEMVRPETAMMFETMQKAFLRSRANSIEGGTTEVMKNILGERVLGLPGDVRVDREVPWSQVPRN